jgi:hypothetical protein
MNYVVEPLRALERKTIDLDNPDSPDGCAALSLYLPMHEMFRITYDVPVDLDAVSSTVVGMFASYARSQIPSAEISSRRIEGEPGVWRITVPNTRCGVLIFPETPGEGQIFRDLHGVNPAQASLGNLHFPVQPQRNYVVVNSTPGLTLLDKL